MRRGHSPTAIPSPRPMDWRLSAGLFFAAGVLESMGFGHLGAFTPLYLVQLHVPPHLVPLWTGILGAIGWILGIPMIPLWGVWAETVSRKFVIVRSAYVEAVLFAVAAWAPSVWVLAVARLLSGLVVGNTGVMFAVQSDVTPSERLGGAVALVASASPVGMAVGPLLGAWVLRVWGIRTLLWGDAGLSLLSGLALTYLLRDVRRRPAAQGPTGLMVRQTLRLIAAAPGVLAVFLVSFAGNLGTQVVTPFVPILVERLARAPAREAATLIGEVLTASGVVLAVSTPLWGRLGDRWGHLRALRASLLGSVLALAAQAVAPGLWTFAWARVALAAFQGGLASLTTTLLAVRVESTRRSAVLNFSLLPMQFTWFLGPILGALLSQWGVRAVWWGALPLSMASFALALSPWVAARPAQHPATPGSTRSLPLPGK